MIPATPQTLTPAGIATAAAGRTTVDFLLGDWLVQPSLNRVSRHGENHQLEPKVMDVLVFLSLQEGRVVAQPEIVSAIWAKRFMARTVVPRAIAELRRTLGDDAQAPRFIQTIQKRGYRLLVPALPATGRPDENANERHVRLFSRTSAGKASRADFDVPAPNGVRYARWMLVAACLVVSVAVLVGIIVATLAEKLSAAAQPDASKSHASASRPLQDLSRELARGHLTGPASSCLEL